MSSKIFCLRISTLIISFLVSFFKGKVLGVATVLIVEKTSTFCDDNPKITMRDPRIAKDTIFVHHVMHDHERSNDFWGEGGNWSVSLYLSVFSSRVCCIVEALLPVQCRYFDRATK